MLGIPRKRKQNRSVLQLWPYLSKVAVDSRERVCGGCDGCRVGAPVAQVRDVRLAVTRSQLKAREPSCSKLVGNRSLLYRNRILKVNAGLQYFKSFFKTYKICISLGR